MENIPKTKEVERIIKEMPFFSLQTLQSLDIEDYYLKIILSRLKSKEKVVSLKRGVYVSSYFLEEMRRKNSWNSYLEFLSSTLYFPSYLSLEYVLNEYNVLSESSFGFSAISTKKTTKFKNNLGVFHYHNIKKELFTGFKLIKKNNFLIYKATLAKALFDFLYLRKSMLISKNYFKSLRLNMEQVGSEDIEEFGEYVSLKKDKRMEDIFKFLKEG